jgi:hypothetical protein
MPMMLVIVEVGVLMCGDDVKKWSLLLLLLLSMNCGLLSLPQRTEAMNAEQIFKPLIATSNRSSNRHGDGSIVVCDLYVACGAADTLPDAAMTHTML